MSFNIVLFEPEIPNNEPETPRAEADVQALETWNCDNINVLNAT